VEMRLQRLTNRPNRVIYSAPFSKLHFLLEEFHMSRHSTVLFAVTVVFLIASHQARAQTTVTFGKGQPTSNAPGKIDGSGSFTVDKGYSVSEVVIYARLLPGPGQGGQVTATLDEKEKKFSGQIIGLPGGDYEIHAGIRVTKKGSPDRYFTSAIVKVTVIAAP
jgi:hypothetical protein